MALSDFLGNTSELRIVDFLAENLDIEYNPTELSEHIGISRVTLYEKLPKLIHNKIVVISSERGRMKFFKLADNKITENLIKAVFAHSFTMAEEEKEEEEAVRDISHQIKDVSEVERLPSNYMMSSSESHPTIDSSIEYSEMREKQFMPIPV
ncbi:hypothetical protein BMS3Bbin15_00400 [archaeon BMS3Bbin15]|nr:hypothetical protein BMS3Bbin15_00400 [archaeon BMS3Bbin15]